MLFEKVESKYHIEGLMFLCQKIMISQSSSLLFRRICCFFGRFIKEDFFNFVFCECECVGERESECVRACVRERETERLCCLRAKNRVGAPQIHIDCFPTQIRFQNFDGLVSIHNRGLRRIF